MPVGAVEPDSRDDCPKVCPGASGRGLTASLPSPPVRRVVIGSFGAIARLGIQELLAQCDCRVVGEEPDTASLAARVADLQPDAVVFDADLGDAAALADSLHDRFPDVAVVAVSSSRPEVRVYPARPQPPYTRALDREALAHALG